MIDLKIYQVPKNLWSVFHQQNQIACLLAKTDIDDSFEKIYQSLCAAFYSLSNDVKLLHTVINCLYRTNLYILDTIQARALCSHFAQFYLK